MREEVWDEGGGVGCTTLILRTCTCVLFNPFRTNVWCY